MADTDKMDELQTAAYAEGRADERQDMSPAARDVLDERERQRGAEGYTDAHDDEHGPRELAAAAACYALHTEPMGNVGDYLRFWPWEAEAWKPKDSRRNLVRAAALILAAIECGDRDEERDAQQQSAEDWADRRGLHPLYP